MAATQLYPGRSSRFGAWCRDAGFSFGLTDIDGFTASPIGLALLEHRTNGFVGEAGSGSLAAVETFAATIKFAFAVVPAFGPGHVDLRQLVWLAYRSGRALGVFATTDNTWPDDAVDPTWRGHSLPPLTPWIKIADAAAAAGIKQRIVRCERDGSPVLEGKRWLMQL